MGPAIDALAAGGFRSTDFFVPANVCSPSRAPFKSLGGDLYELNVEEVSKQKKNRIRI